MSVEHLGISLEYARPNTVVILEMLRDIKNLNNPLCPIPEKIGIAKAWAYFMCRLVARCVDPDEVDVTRPESLRKLIELMMEYIARELGKSRGHL